MTDEQVPGADLGDIDALIALLRDTSHQATDGPWYFSEDACSDDGLRYTPARVWADGGVDPFGETNSEYTLATNVTNPDARHIAAARPDVIRALLDHIDALTAQVR